MGWLRKESFTDRREDMSSVAKRHQAQERIFRFTCLLILVLGAFPMLLPFSWLVLSSLKSREKVLAEEGGWLPWEEDFFVLRHGKKVPVIVLGPVPERPGEVLVIPPDRDPEKPFLLPEKAVRKEKGVTVFEFLGKKLAVDLLPGRQAAGQIAIRTRPFSEKEKERLGLPPDTPFGVPVRKEKLVRQKRLAWHFENYREIFRKDPAFFGYILNSLFLSLVNILGNVLSCGLVGYAFSRLRFPGRNFLFYVALSAMMLPAQVTMIPVFVSWVKLGALDTYFPLTVPSFLAQSAFFIFLYRQFFLTLPRELEEAAQVDGASPVRIFFEVALPLAKPCAVTVAIFTFLGAWNDFLGPLLYVVSDEKQTLALALYNFRTTFGYREPHLVMASSCLMTLPTILIFLLAQRVFIRGVILTGLKG